MPPPHPTPTFLFVEQMKGVGKERIKNKIKEKIIRADTRRTKEAMPKASGRLSLCTLMSRAARRLSRKVSRLFKVDFHRTLLQTQSEAPPPFHMCTDSLRIFVEVTGDGPYLPTCTSSWSSVSQHSFHVAGRAEEEGVEGAGLESGGPKTCSVCA